MFGMRNASIAAAMLWACANLAMAQALYRVVNVPPGDSLALRQSPNYRAPKVWNIPRDAVGIEGVGRRISIQGAHWLRVNVKGRRGWVNARFLAPSAKTNAKEGPRNAQPQIGPLHAALDCVGEGPSWLFRADGREFRLRDADSNTRIWISKGPFLNQRDGSWRVAGKSIAIPRTHLSGYLRTSGECEAATGADASQMAIKLSFGGHDFRGCCVVTALKPDS